MQKSQQLVECAVKQDMMGGMEGWEGEQEGVECLWHPGMGCRTLQGVF